MLVTYLGLKHGVNPDVPAASPGNCPFDGDDSCRTCLFRAFSPPGADALHRPAGTHALAARLPAAFIPSGVGTRFEFAAADA